MKIHHDMPTQKQIAEATGLHKTTVFKHCQEISLQRSAGIFRPLSRRVLLGLFGSASKGDPKAAKLWFQIVDGYVEKREVSGEIGLFDNRSDEERVDSFISRMTPDQRRERLAMLKKKYAT